MKDSCTYNEVIPNPPKLGVPGALIRVTFIQWQKAILFSLLPSKVMLLGRHHCGTPPVVHVGNQFLHQRRRRSTYRRRAVLATAAAVLL